jgi:putative sterol carrier protein
MEERLRGLINRFNSKVEEDARLKEDLQGIERSIQIEAGEERYYFHLRDGRIEGFSEGTLDNPDVRVSSDRATFVGLIDRQIPPMKALASGKLRIKASLDDMLRLRKLF